MSCLLWSGDYYNPHYKSLATQFKGEAHKYIEEKVVELKRKGLEKVSTIFFEGSPAEEIITLLVGSRIAYLRCARMGDRASAGGRSEA